MPPSASKGRSGPLIITVAAVGAELTPEQQPNLPITPDDVGRDAEQCAAAGASIYHLHVRDGSGAPTMDIGAFAVAKDEIERRTDLIVQFTSGGAVTDTSDKRLAPLDLRPEMASLTTGTVNFGDDVFLNPIPMVRLFYGRMRSLGILPEFEIFEAGMIASADRLYHEAGSDHHRHYDFVLGVPGGMPAWADSVEFLAGHIPADATWSATGIGKHHLDVTEAAISNGGHVRAGLEDVRYFAPRELATSNAQLIERVAEMGRSAGRPIATPSQTRELLGLSEERGNL
ncbi:MAG: 3-keto-5-aminohexanoate cleavage protein [Actinomycetota bacterium]